MKTIPIADIVLDHKRQREDVGDLNELCNSFNIFGQLQPIIIDQDNRIVAGFRRLAAATLLEWEEIGFERREDLDEVKRREIELEENVRRKQLSWQEEVAAIAEIHRLRVDDDPEWTAAQTGEIIGKSPRLAQLAVELSENLDKPGVAQAQTMVGAIQRLRSERQISRKRAEADAVSKEQSARFSLLVGPAEEQIREVPDESIDCIVTNPPFGVDLDFKGTKPYEDDELKIMNLMAQLIPEWYRVLKDDSWVACFFDIIKLFPWGPLTVTTEADITHGIACRPGLIQLMEDAGFKVNHIPCIWAKPNKTQGVLRDPNTTLIVAYEAFILARKGEPTLLKKGRQNIFIFDAPTAAERIHPVQMPTDLPEELITMLSVGGQLVMDCFCGSGSIGVAALRQQRRFLGIELNPEYADRARARLHEAASGA